jgi:hypothetical protein
MKEQNNGRVIGIMLSVFVILILGAVLVTQISDTTISKTKETIATETVTAVRVGASNKMNDTYGYHLTNGCPGSSWRAGYSECNVEILSIKNSTGALLAETTDYVVSKTNAACTGTGAGDFKFTSGVIMNETTASNSTTVAYSYCPQEYMAESWSRTILDLVPGFFVIGLLGASLLFGIWYFRENY